MRPTVETRLGFEDQSSKNPGSRRIAKRYEIARFRLSVSRRDSRSQPAVLTPGTDPKNAPPQPGGTVDISRFPNSLYLQRPICRPFRAMPYGIASPGLKPRTQSYNPFGISSIRFRTAGLSLIELLVVLSIVALISALITTSVLSALKQQNQRVCLNNMLTIEAAKDEYLRDHPGVTSIPGLEAFQPYFRFGIPRCPDGGTYNGLYSLTQPVTCTYHTNNSVYPTPTP
jgi:prepilin-type N-terminal cleavage/methylation domain-containing protein